MKREKEKRMKGELTLTAAIGLLVGIMLLIPVIKLGSDLMRVDDGTLASFNNLANSIENLYNDKTLSVDTQTLLIRKNNAIIGLTQDAESVWYRFTGANFLIGPNAIFKRPAECPKGKACICLCRGMEVGQKVKASVNTYYLSCASNRLTCRSFEKLDFPSNLDKKHFLDAHDSYQLSGGFIYGRDGVQVLSLRGLEAGKTTPDYVYILLQRPLFSSAVRLQKAGNIIGYCENPDPTDGCLSPDILTDVQAVDVLQNNFKELIELCSERTGDVCACSPLNFLNLMPRGYYIEFSDAEGKLKLTLKNKDNVEIKSIVINSTAYCAVDVNMARQGMEGAYYKPEIDVSTKDLLRNFVFSFDNTDMLLFVKNKKDVCLGAHPPIEKWEVMPNLNVGFLGDVFEGCGFGKAPDMYPGD